MSNKLTKPVFVRTKQDIQDGEVVIIASDRGAMQNGTRAALNVPGKRRLVVISKLLLRNVVRKLSEGIDRGYVVFVDTHSIRANHKDWQIIMQDVEEARLIPVGRRRTIEYLGKHDVVLVNFDDIDCREGPPSFAALLRQAKVNGATVVVLTTDVAGLPDDVSEAVDRVLGLTTGRRLKLL